MLSTCLAYVSGVFPASLPPNHILLNEYRDGQGISPHKDGPLYHPLVAVLSLGDSATIHFSARPDGARATHTYMSSVVCLALR